MFDLPFKLPDGWAVKTVEQLIKDEIIEKPLDGNHGGIHPKASDYVEEGVPFVMASDLDAGRVNFNRCKFITEEQASTLRKGFSKIGDVLISHKATIGRTAIVQENDHDFIMLTPQVTYYRIKDESNLNNVYLKAYFDSNFFQTILGLWAGAGSTRAYLGITGQLKLPVIVPPIESQVSIAGHASAINDYIELNRQTSQNLEQIAQAIFKSWFVDFEPTRAKIAAKQNGQDPERAAMAAISGLSSSGAAGASLEALDQLSPEQQQQLITTAALFPDALVESGFGEIPEGWEVKKLKDICRVLNGRAYKNIEFKKEGTPIVRIQNLSGGGKGGKTVYSDLDLHLDKLIHEEDFIYAWSATFGPHIWRGQKSIYHYHIWKMDVNEEVVSRYFLYLSMFNKTEQMKSGATGSIFTHLTKSMMEGQEILVADHELNMFFKALLDIYYKKITILNKEIEIFTGLRNALLPELLSGSKEVFGDAC
jgi:type I restriction enzyme, S subunit